MNIWLHGHCPKHRSVFITEQGTNPRWVALGDALWATIRDEYQKQEPDLHIRRCQICVDELVAEVTKDWHKKSFSATGG